MLREEFDEEDIALLDSFFPPSPKQPDGDEGTTINVGVSGDGNNNCATTDVSNHTSAVNLLLPGFDVPLITGTEGTSSNVQAYGAVADDVPNSSDIDISAILAGFDSPLATNFAEADDVWNDDDIAVLSAILGCDSPLPAGNEGTATSAVNPTVIPSTSTDGNGSNNNIVGVATDQSANAQAGNNMLLVTNVSAGCCGHTDQRMALGSGFSAPILLDIAENMRPADVCDKPEEDIMSRCFTLIPEGFSPSFLLESPIFLPDSPVPPSPTTGKLISSIPSGNNQINIVSAAITDKQLKNKGKEIVIEQGSSSFAKNNHGAAASVQQNMGGMHHQILPDDYAAFTVAMRNTVNALSSSGVHHPPLYNHGTGISFPCSGNSFLQQQHSNFYPQANNNSTFFGPPANNRASGGVTTTTVASAGPIIANRVGGGVTVAERIIHAVPDDEPLDDIVEEDKGRMAPKNGKYISRDGYNWRKYGQKPLRGSEYPRAYYKCTFQDCPVKKQVEWAPDGHVTEIIYKGQHNHPKPVPPKPGPPPPESEPENQVTASSTSFSNEEGGEDPAATESDASGSKRRRSVKQQRYIFQTASDVDIIEDGYRWRKYGQKIVKGNPNPRSYYKCTTIGCEVRKHVERATKNRIMVICSYEGNHTHEAPIPRRNNPNPPAPAQDALTRLRPGPPPIPSTARPSQGGSLGRPRPRVHGSLPSNLTSKSIGNVNNVTANNQSLGDQPGQKSGDAMGTTMPKPGPVTASGGLSTSPSGGSFATFYGGLSGSTGGGSYNAFYGGRSSSARGTRFCGGLSSSARGGSNTMFYGGSNPTPATANARLNNASTSNAGRLNTAPNGGGVGGYQFNAGGVNTTAPNGGGGVGSYSISQHLNGVRNNNTGNGVLSTTGNVGLNTMSTSYGVYNSERTGNGALNAASNGGSNTTSSSIYDHLFIAAGFNPTSNGGLYTASNGVGSNGGSSVYQQFNGGLYAPSNGGGLNNTTSYGGFNSPANGGLNTTGNGGGLNNNNRANGGFNSAAVNGRRIAPANGGLNTTGNGGGLNNYVGLSATANGGIFNSASANGGLYAPAANGGMNSTGNGGLNNNGATGGFNTNTAYGGRLNAPASNGGMNSTGNGGLNNNGATGGFNTNTAYGGRLNAPAANGGMNTTGNSGYGANGGLNATANGRGFNSTTAYGGLLINTTPNSGLNAHANGGAGGGSSMHQQFPGSLPPPQM